MLQVRENNYQLMGCEVKKFICDLGIAIQNIMIQFITNVYPFKRYQQVMEDRIPLLCLQKFRGSIHSFKIL